MLAHIQNFSDATLVVAIAVVSMVTGAIFSIAQLLRR